MPEGPEIETICRNLQEFILKKKIDQVIVRSTKLRYIVEDDLAQKIQGKTILEIQRIAKYINIILEGEYNLVIHLGMSGKLLLYMDKVDFSKHDHIIIKFDDGTSLYYNDPRRFGMVNLIAKHDFTENKLFAKLGVDPLSDNFNLSYLRQKLTKRLISIKSALMNNEIVTDIGNIYASESLHMAKVNPYIAANNLNNGQLESLIKAVRLVLNKAIELKGSSFSDYRTLNGQVGNFQNHFKVYQRAGLPCYECGEIIVKVKLSGRASYYCPQCQSA